MPGSCTSLNAEDAGTQWVKSTLWMKRVFYISALNVISVVWSTGNQVHFVFFLIFRVRFYNFHLHPLISGTAAVPVPEISGECAKEYSCCFKTSVAAPSVFHKKSGLEAQDIPRISPGQLPFCAPVWTDYSPSPNRSTPILNIANTCVSFPVPFCCWLAKENL